MVKDDDTGRSHLSVQPDSSSGLPAATVLSAQSRQGEAVSVEMHSTVLQPTKATLCTAAGSVVRTRQLVRPRAYYLGIDFGTSGARATVIDGRQCAPSCSASSCAALDGNAGLV